MTQWSKVELKGFTNRTGYQMRLGLALGECKGDGCPETKRFQIKVGRKGAVDEGRIGP